MDSDFRPPTPYERKLLEKLLERDFPGRDALRQQLDSVKVKPWEEEDGSLELSVSSGPEAKVRYRVPAEGMCPDTDGMLIQVLLHVVHGKMRELEIFRLDGSKILRPPASEALDLWSPGPLPI